MRYVIVVETTPDSSLSDPDAEDGLSDEGRQSLIRGLGNQGFMLRDVEVE